MKEENKKNKAEHAQDSRERRFVKSDSPMNILIRESTQTAMKNGCVNVDAVSF